MLPDLQSRFDQYNQKREALLQNLSALATAMQAVFRHPVAGPLTPDRALRLAHLHLDTHIRQIDRIRRVMGFKQFLLEVLSGFIYITLNTAIKA
ncbi:MAG: hypothetical protein WCF40_03455 [Desulfobacterales bacterium]|jgi:hypothetical protein